VGTPTCHPHLDCWGWTLEERKISCSCWESGQDSVAVWPVALSLCGLHCHDSITIYGYFEITFSQNIHVFNLKGAGKTHYGAAGKRWSFSAKFEAAILTKAELSTILFITVTLLYL